jgi:hypothetical protein
MNKKDQYVQIMQAKLDEWSAEVDALSTRASQVTAGLRTEYGAQIDSLQAKQLVARQKLGELQKSGVDAWEDLKGGIESAWKAMGEALDSARSRF